jgi:hypothetical protein
MDISPAPGVPEPKDKLSMVVANYSELEAYGKARQLASLARLPAASSLTC